MHRRVKSSRSYNEYNNCNSQGNQIIILGAIISAIIYQEIQNDDDLNTIGNLFIAIGSNIVVGVSQRSACTNNINKNNSTDNLDNQNTTLGRNNNYNRSKKIKKIKKIKKVKKIK